MNTEPQIEPVTERDIDEVLNARAAGYDIRYALEQDRRRVAERQAARHSVGSTLRHTNVARLRELSHAVTQGPDAIRRECSMRVPAEPDRDADLVLSSAADEIERLRAEVAAHRKHDVLRCDALMKAEAEVAKLKSETADKILAVSAACDVAVQRLRAACAAKDEALRVIDANDNSVLDSVVIAAALALDAGRNWIDASGAVEARLHCEYGDPSVGVGDHWFLTDNDMDYTWAGSKVKIVQVKP